MRYMAIMILITTIDVIYFICSFFAPPKNEPKKEPFMMCFLMRIIPNTFPKDSLEMELFFILARRKI